MENKIVWVWKSQENEGSFIIRECHCFKTGANLKVKFKYKYGNFTLDIATATMMLANILHNSLPLTTITGSVSSIYTNKQVWCHIKLRDRYFEFICLDIDCESVLDGVAVALTYVDAAELLQGISEVRQSNESNNRS